MGNPAQKLKVVRTERPVATPARTPRQTPASLAKRRCEVLSYFIGAGCVAGLVLSGIDSAIAVEKFMQQPLWRAAMFAVVIDGLLVGGELTTILTKCPLAKKYATWYIWGAGFLSIVLNAAEFASTATDPWLRVMNAGAGGLVPLLVILSSKYAGYLYLSSQ